MGGGDLELGSCTVKLDELVKLCPDWDSVKGFTTFTTIDAVSHDGYARATPPMRARAQSHPIDFSCTLAREIIACTCVHHGSLLGKRPSKKWLVL